MVRKVHIWIKAFATSFLNNAFYYVFVFGEAKEETFYFLLSAICQLWHCHIKTLVKLSDIKH